MHFQFTADRLTTLFTTGKAAGCIPVTIVDAFFEVMAIIAAAVEERDVCTLTLARATTCSGCTAIHLQGNLHLLTRFCCDENGLYAEIIDIVEVFDLARGSYEPEAPTSPSSFAWSHSGKCT